jgi:acyl-CoA thioesterase
MPQTSATAEESLDLKARAPHQSAFARAVQAQRSTTDPDHWTAVVDDSWRVLRGPNGGFLAGLLLQTMSQRLADPTRRARVLSLHYPKVPNAGPVEIRTSVSRSGRSMSWLTAELWQADELCVAARAAFSSDWPGVEFNQHTPPNLLPPEQGQVLTQGLPPFTRHFHYRSLYATPLADNGADAVGGYIRLREPHAYDEPLIATLADAWFPATFAFDRRPVMGATLDLTIHFRDHSALDSLTASDYVISIFRTRLANEGFFEEDGEIWSRDGRLIAQSRQLAIATPYSR